jgi:hypothetical protein
MPDIDEHMLNANDDHSWLKAMACTKASPEAWERYLILEQVAQGRFMSLPERFRQAYADLIEQLSAEKLLLAVSAGFLVTESGRHWKQVFADNNL